MKRYLMLTVCAVACLFSVSANAQEPPKPLAHFRFDGDANDSSGHNTRVQLRNAEFKSGALYANGKYDKGAERNGATTCKIMTPSLDYDAFTVAMRFQAQEFETRKRNIITGGPSYRWFGLYRGNSGNLTVMLNGNRFKREIPVSLATGQWYTIVCGVDLNAGTVRTHVNGKEVATIKLPAGFKFRVATSRRKDSDKVWTFNNYSNATVFHGLVDELVVYGELLSSKFARELILGSANAGNSNNAGQGAGANNITIIRSEKGNPSIRHEYLVQNKWGRSHWRDGGVWNLGSQKQRLVAINIFSSDEGETLVGAVRFSADKSVNFKANRIRGNHYAVSLQLEEFSSRWTPEKSDWVIGGRTTKRVIHLKASSSDQGNSLTGMMTYAGEGKIMFQARLNRDDSDRSESTRNNRGSGNTKVVLTSTTTPNNASTSKLMKIKTPPGTQPSGLAFHDGYFYMSSYIRNAGIYKIRASDGLVVDRFSPLVPRFKGRYGGLAVGERGLVHVQANNNYAGTFDGLAFDELNPIKPINLKIEPDCSDLAIHENTMWLVSAHHSSRTPVAPLVYVIDLKKREVIRTFPLPFAENDQNHGMTYGNGYLFMSAGRSIVKIDPDTFEILDRIEGPSDRLESLAWDGHDVWAASFRGGLFRVRFKNDANRAAVARKKDTARVSLAPNTYPGLAEWLEKTKALETDLDNLIASTKNDAQNNQQDNTLMIWRVGSRNNRMPDSKIPERLQSIAKDAGCDLKMRVIRFRDFEAAFDEAVENNELPDILSFGNYGTANTLQAKSDDQWVHIDGSLAFWRGWTVLFPSSKNYKLAMAFALRKPTTPVVLEKAGTNLDHQNAEEVKSLCLASFRAFVTDDMVAMTRFSDPSSIENIPQKLANVSSIDVLSVEVSGLVGNDHLAVAHVNSRTRSKRTNENKNVGHFGSMERVFVCRKTNGVWKVLLSAKTGSRMTDELIDVVGNTSADAGTSQTNMKVPAIVSPEDGARASRFPRPDITWETCGTNNASYFVESQFSSSRQRNWSESWLKKIDGVKTKNETITIQAPFGIGSQPHRWRVWAISSGGQVTLSDWRTINYRN